MGRASIAAVLWLTATMAAPHRSWNVHAPFCAVLVGIGIVQQQSAMTLTFPVLCPKASCQEDVPPA